MALTRPSPANDQRQETNSIEDDLILDMEENPENQNERNSPPNVNENNQNTSNTQNQPATAQTSTDSDIADWVKTEFEKATEGSTAEEKLEYASILLGDRSMLTTFSTYLTMTDTSDNVCLMYGLTMVPSPYQTGNEQQIIGFFDKRRSEVPSTQWITPLQAMDSITVNIPPLQEIIEAKRTDPNVKFIPHNETWRAVACPPIAPFPTQWADQIKDQHISPMNLALKLESSISSWSEEDKQKIQPLFDWVLGACVRAVVSNQNEGSILKLPWRSFYFIKDSTFQWASNRLGSILGPWNHRRNVQQASENQLTTVLAQLSAAVTQQAHILSAWRGTNSDASIPRIIGTTPTPQDIYQNTKSQNFCLSVV